MPVEDAEMTRSIRREISRRYIDSTNLDVRCIHGVVYLTGRIERLRSHPEIDMREELEVIQKVIRQRPGVRDVVCEVDIARSALRDRVAALKGEH